MRPAAVSQLLNRVTEPVVALLAAFFTLLLMISVVSRYVFDFSIVESVELTRIAFLWSVFLAAAAVVGRNAHIRITFLTNRFAASRFGLLQRAVHLTIAGFGVLMVWQGTLLTTKMAATSLPASGISQLWLYAVLPVSGSLIVLHALCHAIDLPPLPGEVHP